MATTAKSGKFGFVEIDSVSTYEVTQWTANLEDDMLDGTSFASNGWKESVVGLRGATGSMTLLGDVAPSTASAAAAIVLQEGVTTGDYKITANAFFQTRGVSTPVDGRVEFTVDWTATGAVTEGTV